MKEPIISVDKLTRSYGQGDNVTNVLRGMTMRVEPGEFVIIFGPSGSGKSTLLNILSGLENISSGKVIIDGQDLDTLQGIDRARFHREKIGMVFQAYNLIPSLTVLQNITLPLVFSKVPKKERTTRALKLLTDFKMEKLANRLPMEISGGQAQRVGIMRALVINPPIIIADEPTGNLDSQATKNVMDLFRDLNHTFHNTLLVVTHDPGLFIYADRIIHVLDGTIVKETARKNHKGSYSAPSEFDSLHEKEKDPLNRKILDILVMMLSRHQLASFHLSELEKMMQLLAARFRKKITERELYESLDKPVKQGGVGLYQPTARHIAEHFEHILGLLN